MLEQVTFTGRELLLAVILATVVYLIEVLVFAGRRRPRQPPVALPDTVRLDALRSEIDQLKARVEQLEARPPVESALDTQTTTYAEAVRLAREGASSQELALALGISRSEADLIIALHRGEA